MTRPLRTAVLVVHGMGSQRPLETVRGVVNAVWFDDDDHTKSGKRLWSHPQPSGVDLDLTVMTTNEVPGTKPARVVDFHELYWAHHMSETKAVAVLLWLFELGRRGPHFKTGMNGLWWCGAVYLCLLLLSVTHLSLIGLTWFAGVAERPYAIPLTFSLMAAVAIVIGCAAAFLWKYLKLARWLLLGVVGFAVLAVAAYYTVQGLHAYGAAAKPVAAFITNIVLTPTIALIATALLMRGPGVKVFCLTYVLSWVFFGLFLLLIAARILPNEHWWNILSVGRMPWSFGSRSSAVAALLIIGVYLIVNAWFLQPYLGDAARYFRNSPANVAVRRIIRKDAVDTLDQLHRSRDYDRIVVVAHSLGTVVAYDMLRAYYSRICDQIPIDKDKLGPQFDRVDGGALDCAGQRREGRQLIGKFAEVCSLLDDAKRQGHYLPARQEEVDAWLVTDFVTVGSPLTHARYLMTNAGSEAEIDQEFWNHVRERDFPLCPPHRQNSDGLLAFRTPQGTVRLHHGGLFGMTRWTNLYFPVVNIFWGDAIGGPVQAVFGGCVKDVAVSTVTSGAPAVFTHTAYWKTDAPDKRKAPHLAALIEAVDLVDKDRV